MDSTLYAILAALSVYYLGLYLYKRSAPSLRNVTGPPPMNFLLGNHLLAEAYTVDLQEMYRNSCLQRGTSSIPILLEIMGAWSNFMLFVG